ncbi:vesicle-associated membrane protein 7-like [Gigantopelta aegis]|uniref:vesicle-associated membrane protein 7-like n=1 Tax=Gigantopelta aegis TaxID=1735272 RepID=UPI001B88A991|nr:vesicle-associated membrane protein 7-like [Gigantopelta aegis]
MTIQYSCITRGTIVLCSHQAESGNFQTTVSHILPNIPTSSNAKTTYTSDNYCFHCIINNGLIYLCVTDPQFGKQKPYLFLEEIKSVFHSKNLVSQAETAGTDDLNAEFSHIMSREMKRFSKQGNDALTMLQTQMDDVKGVMNIERVQERGERLDDLMDKTEELEATAKAFNMTAHKVQKTYCWKNTKMTMWLVLIGVVVTVVIIIIILASTGVFKSGSDSKGAVTPTPTPSG